MGTYGADGASGATGYEGSITPEGSRFCFVGKGNDEQRKGSENSEAYTFGFDGSSRFGGDDGGYGCSGIRRPASGKKRGQWSTGVKRRRKVYTTIRVG